MLNLSRQIRFGLLSLLLLNTSIEAQSPSGPVRLSGIESLTDPTTHSIAKYYPTQWRTWDEHAAFNVGQSAPCEDGCMECPDGDIWYFQVGPIALQRIRWEGGTFLTRDGDAVLATDDFESRLEWGGRFSVGKRCWDCSEIEFTGFTVPDMNLSTTARGASSVSAPVFNAPAGFEDFATDASLVGVAYQTDLSGFEVLWRRWCLFGCEDAYRNTRCSGHIHAMLGSLEIGVRYLNIDEQFSVYSQLGAAPAPTGLQDYRYRTSADNHIFGPEIGVQLRTIPWLGFDVLFCSRLSLAVNFIDTSASLRELSPQLAFRESRDEISFAQVWDNSIYLRLRPGHHLDIRAGYQLLWINGYAGASDQFNRNLSQPGQFDDNNSVLFQGPAILMQISF
jgi:hypothetical protein